MPVFIRYRTARIAAAIAMSITAPAGHAGDGEIDACKLLSAAEAGKLLGTAVTVHAVDTSAAGPGAASMCRYSNGHINGGFMLLAGRLHYTDAAREVARQEHASLADTPPGLDKPTFANVSGLGDAAYLARTAGYFQLHVLAHGTAIVINRNIAPSAKAVAQAKQIARAVLGKLGH